jgi:hypothetical protein
MCAAPRRLSCRRVAELASAAGISALLLVVAPPMAVSQQGGGGVVHPNIIPNELLVKFAPGVSRANAEEILQRAGTQTIGAPSLEGRLFHVRVPDANAVVAVKTALERVPSVEYVEAVQTVTIQPKN